VTPPGPRRRAREAALQVLYAADLAQRLEPAAVDEVHGELIAEFELPRNARERARSLAVGVACNLKGIDEAISDGGAERAAHRRLRAPVRARDTHRGDHRRGGGDRPPLRGEAAPGFVNGLLDEVARAHRGARDAPWEGAER
jgi:transcription termination factor NusB